MQTKDRITIEVPAGASKALSFISKASGVSRAKLISSIFVIIASEALKDALHKTEKTLNSSKK